MKNLYKQLAVAALIALFSVSVQAQNLTGHWTFEEGSGDTSADQSGNKNNLSIFNATNGGLNDGSFWHTDADRGAVASFGGEGNDAYALADNEIPVMTLKQDFTWAFWANDLSEGEPNNIIFGNRYDLTLAEFSPRQFIKFTPTKFEWHMNSNWNDDLEYGPDDPAANDIPNGEWMHHAVVKNGPTLTYYRNGAAQNSADITQPLTEPQPLFIGGDNEGKGKKNWRGLIDDVRIYDGAISAAAVAELAQPQTNKK